jgi:hypothetical protein
VTVCSSLMAAPGSTEAKSISRCAMTFGWIALVQGYRVRPG